MYRFVNSDVCGSNSNSLCYMNGSREDLSATNEESGRDESDNNEGNTNFTIFDLFLVISSKP